MSNERSQVHPETPTNAPSANPSVSFHVNEDGDQHGNSDDAQLSQVSSSRPTRATLRSSTTAVLLTSDASRVCVLVAALMGRETKVPSKEPHCDHRLDDLVQIRDIKTIASGMQFYLKTESSEEAATKKFFERFPAMQELGEWNGGRGGGGAGMNG